MGVPVQHDCRYVWVHRAHAFPLSRRVRSPGVRALAVIVGEASGSRGGGRRGARSPGPPRYADAVSSVSRDAAEVPHGRARYARYWGTEFWSHVTRALPYTRAMLDVGAG